MCLVPFVPLIGMGASPLRTAYTRRLTTRGATLGALVASGVADRCDGFDVETNPDGSVYSHKCCATSTFSESTWNTKLGITSVRYVLEHIVRNLVTFITPSVINQFVYDSSLDSPKTISPDILSKYAKAVRNFTDLFPENRWYTFAAPTTCSGLDSYTAFGANPHTNPTVQVAALKRILGVNYTQQQSDAWHANAWAIIDTVPRNQGYGFARQAPPTRDPMPVITDFFTVQGTQIVPKPWMQTFLNVFGQSGLAATRAVMTMTSKPKTKTTTKSLPVTQQAQPEKSNTAYYALGGAVLVAASVGLWIKFKKK